MSHDFLSIYPAKLQEYCLAIGYLLLFIPFWKFVQGGPRKAAVVARAAAQEKRAAGATAIAPSSWFHVPSGVRLHPGHTWARLESDGLVSVGIDDFAKALVAPTSVNLPALGSKVVQGEPALALEEDGRSVPMVSPIDGTVVAVNSAAEGALDDPYGAGWLFKVKAPRLAANLRQLLAAAPAARLLEEASEVLVRRMNPELGVAMADGGTPVDGMARALAGDEWDSFAREFFLT